MADWIDVPSAPIQEHRNHITRDSETHFLRPFHKPRP